MRLKIKLVICIFAIVVSFVICEAQESEPDVNLDTLKLVQLIFRHGDRVPEYPYPNDPFSDPATWPQGWAQLTTEGKQQEYNLGQYLRNRYKNYLNSSYVPNQIYAISSDTDRTIMSGQMMLAGLYPANNETNWNTSINWQPVPMRTIMTEQDNLIRFKRKCPRFDKVFDDFIRNSPMMKQINEENKDLYASLSRDSGVNITTINDIDAFYATLFVEEYKGLDIPEWGKGLREDQHFQYLYNLSFHAKTYTEELKRLRGGVLVKYLVNNIEERVNNASSTTKMFAISGHDITLIDIINIFGMSDLLRPWYSSMFILELHQEQNGNFFLEFHYRNDTTRAPYQLKLPGCELQCPLDKVLNYTRPIIPNDWDQECQLLQPEPSLENSGSSIFTYILVAVGIIAVTVFLVGLVSMALKKKRRSVVRHEYQNF